MNKLTLIMVFFFLGFAIYAQENDLITYYEKSGFKETPSYEQTIEYCKQLDISSPFIHYTTFGSSPQGRKLPLLIIDANANFDAPSAKKAGKLVLLIEAGIHAGEIDGKDAGLMFFRDLAINQKFGPMPANVTILFIPIFNVDGHERSGPYNRINQHGPEEMGWRTTAQNLNLNRDFLKADAPEMQAWLKLYQQWQPDFFVDIHVTDGADYQYVMTYGLETHGNMDEGLTRHCTEDFIPAMENFMETAGYPAFPYVMFRKWHDPRSGLRSSVGGPKYSQGYAAAQNRIGLLVENHSLKDYKTRVDGTYELLHFICNYLDYSAAEIKELNTMADNLAASEAFRREPFAVNYAAGKDSIIVDFRGVEYDVVKSNLTGGDWFLYYPDKPVTYKVPYFYQQLPSATVNIPEGYIIPPEWTEIIARLTLHGIKYHTLLKNEQLEVESYRFTKVEFAKSTYEGRTQVTPTFETYTETREYPAGSVVIPTAQPQVRIIAHMFEPASNESFLQWGYFNAIFELKEYFETYKMEEYARKMLVETPGLNEEFEGWKAANPEAAKSQWSQLEWFYFRSPWVDSKRNIYPVGRIVDGAEIKKLGL